MDTAFHPVLPADMGECELMVVGSMMLDAGAARCARSALESRMFSNGTLATVFEAACAVMLAGCETPEPPAVVDRLRDTGTLDRIGGIACISEIIEDVPPGGNHEYYIGQVRERWFRRRPAEIYAHAALQAERGELAPEELEQRVESELAELRQLRAAVRTTRLVHARDIENLPRPEFLIGDVVVRKSLPVLVGPPGSGKTLIALSMAASIATGFRWMGREVQTGPVLYVAAEGSAGLGARVRAWKAEHGCALAPNILFLCEPASLAEPADVQKLLAEIELLPEPPVLVVIDTLSRCMAGLDENNQADMSRFVAGADEIRERTGAAVLIVHHSNAAGDRERGSTVLRGAADTMIFAKAEDGVVTVECAKQKDAAPFDKIRLELRPVADSAVVTLTDPMRVTTETLTPIEREILEALNAAFLEDGATASEWLKAQSRPEGTFFRARTALVTKGYVDPGKGGRGSRYIITPEGRQVLTLKLSTHSQLTHREQGNSLTPHPGVYKTPECESEPREFAHEFDGWERNQKGAA